MSDSQNPLVPPDGPCPAARDDRLDSKTYASRATLYLGVKRKREWERMARETGMRLSPWVVQQVELSLRPSTEVVDLRRRLEDVERDRDTFRRDHGRLHKENAELLEQLRDAERSLTGALAGHLRGRA